MALAADSYASPIVYRLQSWDDHKLTWLVK